MATATATAGTFLPANAEPTALPIRAGGDRRSVAGRASDRPGDVTDNTADYSGAFGPIKKVLNQPAVKKSLPLMVIAVALLVFALVYTLINAPTYRPIMTGVTETDQQGVYEALKTGEFKPVIDAGSGQITVPSARYHEARIYLASKGLPKTAATGLDALKDQSAITTSQFMEQVRYNSAMEQEMARSIQQIETIQSARVHLATTKPSVFVRDRTPPKASIVVTPHPGRTVSPMQVQAIVHLVASSVPMLTAENVAVVDHFGKLLTDAASDASLGMNAGQTKHKQAMEDLYRQRVIQILAPIVGDANVRSQVNLNLDYSQTEVTVEDYDTGGKGPKTRSEVNSEDRNSSKEASGIPGTLSNTAPAAPTTTLNTAAPSSDSSDERNTIATRSTRNYELDRSVRRTKSATGGVQRLSVAVVINERAPIAQPKNDKGEDQPPKPNPYTQEELDRIQELVRGVVGFDETRKDVVSVVQAKFEPELAMDLSIPWHKDEAVLTNIKSGFLGLMFVAFLMVVVRPVVMHMMNRDKEAAQAAAQTIQLAQEQALALEMAATEAAAASGAEPSAADSLEEMKAKMKAKKSGISAEMLDTANTYDDKVALLRMIVSDDSARVASVLKNMIKPA
ncbi:MAG: flagellar basal-body MS-ring/collar protein FliF [Rhodoferax sp.]|jgi:flagellar M-ring protein FliF|nr:flagellar basal-body MS-ring/collar protein FliF [Rhodoferax sp.]